MATLREREDAEMGERAPKKRLARRSFEREHLETIGSKKKRLGRIFYRRKGKGSLNEGSAVKGKTKRRKGESMAEDGLLEWGHGGKNAKYICPEEIIGRSTKNKESLNVPERFYIGGPESTREKKRK